MLKDQAEGLVGTIESAPALGAAADELLPAVNRVLDRSGARPLLSGDWLGHPVHPMLTDLAIGFWTSAWVLDLVPVAGTRPVARKLVGLGVLSAVPTIATGWNDWTGLDDRKRRVGLVHAGANALATVTYAASWWARRRGHPARGIALGWLGAAVATVGGFLGGHLAFGSD
jgi:hypothetical protein